MWWSGLCLVASLLVATPAQADEGILPTVPTCVDDCGPSKLRRTGATLASVTTGLFVRGVGSYLVGEKKAAKRLARVSAIGLGAAVGGGLPVGVSGGYPPTMPLMPVLLAGAGLLFTTWWADVGVAAGVSKIGRARTQAPWSLELATLYLSDPYRQTGLGRLGGNVEIGRVQLAASGLLDAENEIRTGEFETRVRVFGPAATGAAVADGSRLIVRSALRGHEDDGDRVSILTAELEVIGRYDLFRLERALAGTFIQLSTGIGVERVAYTGDHDNGSILLGTFGYGVYLGNRGELQLFYDHRRDSMVGGLAAGRAAGFVGSIGGSIDWLLDRRWAAHFEIDVGNAWLTTLAIRYRGGVE
jgi:hypothetical protein